MLCPPSPDRSERSRKLRLPRKVQRVVLAGKVRHEEVLPPVGVEVTDRDPHTRLFFSAGVERHAAPHPDLLEGSVSPVVPKVVGCRVVGHVELGIPVKIGIKRHDAQPVGRFARTERCARRGVFEGSVASAAVQKIVHRRQPLGPST